MKQTKGVYLHVNTCQMVVEKGWLDQGMLAEWNPNLANLGWYTTSKTHLSIYLLSFGNLGLKSSNFIRISYYPSQPINLFETGICWVWPQQIVNKWKCKHKGSAWASEGRLDNSLQEWTNSHRHTIRDGWMGGWMERPYFFMGSNARANHCGYLSYYPPTKNPLRLDLCAAYLMNLLT
jgi:hypothetical protein